MLEVQNLRCERNRRVLFEGLSFGARAGEVLQIEGPNGAGKSTLLKILMGIYEEFDGTIGWQLDDYPLYLGHRSGVNDYLTVNENLSWMAKLHDQNISSADIGEMLAAVGLESYADVVCGNLSEGQRKRVNLARLYAFNNKVWVLDEPLSAVDSDGIQSLEARIQKHSEAGGLVLFTSHQSLALRNVRKLVLGDEH